MTIKIFKWFIPLVILLVYYGCKDKEYDVFGELCNYRKDTINIILSPYTEFQQIQNGNFHLQSHNATADTAFYKVYPNFCSTMVRGANDIHESDLSFSYLEIRTESDTIIGKGKAEISALFKGVRKGLKRIEVN